MYSPAEPDATRCPRWCFFFTVISCPSSRAAMVSFAAHLCIFQQRAPTLTYRHRQQPFGAKCMHKEKKIRSDVSHYWAVDLRQLCLNLRISVNVIHCDKDGLDIQFMQVLFHTGSRTVIPTENNENGCGLQETSRFRKPLTTQN